MGDLRKGKQHHECQPTLPLAAPWVKKQCDVERQGLEAGPGLSPGSAG